MEKFDFFEQFVNEIEADKDTAELVEQVSDLIHSLQLDSADKDRLVIAMSDLLNIARRNMYLAGGCAAARLFIDKSKVS